MSSAGGRRRRSSAALRGRRGRSQHNDITLCSAGGGRRRSPADLFVARADTPSSWARTATASVIIMAATDAAVFSVPMISTSRGSARLHAVGAGLNPFINQSRRGQPPRWWRQDAVLRRWRRLAGALAGTVPTPSTDQTLVGVAAVNLTMSLLQAAMAGSAAVLDKVSACWRGKGRRGPPSWMAVIGRQGSPPVRSSNELPAILWAGFRARWLD